MQTSPANRPQILVVEDERAMASFIQESLQHLGYGITAVAESGEDAIRKAEETHPDLVLMDILLSGNTDGVAAAEHISNQLNIPVVYITTYADEMTLHRAKLSRPAGYLVKPLQEDELRATIEIALYKHQLQKLSEGFEKRAMPILQSLSAGVIATDANGLVSFMNHTAEVMTGMTLMDASGLELSGVFKVSKQTENPLTKGSVHKRFRERTTLIARDGRQIPIDYIGTVIRSGTGAASEGYVLTFYDVSERKKVEDALEESRVKYKELLNTLDGIVWEADGRTHQFQFVSRKSEKILGYPVERWYSRVDFWRELIHPDDRERILAIYSGNVAEQRDHQLEYRMISSAGQLVWIRDTISVIAEEGKPIKTRGFMVDISAMHEADEKLRRLEKAIETSQIGITITDMSRKIIYTNPADAAMHGFTVDELVGQDVRKFAAREKWQPMSQENIRSMTSWRREGVNLRKDGSTFPVQLMSDVVISASGEPIGIVTTCEDITERKALEEAYLRAHEELERRVQERTSALSKVIEDLREQVIVRKRTEEALDESEQRYRTLVRSMSQGLIQVDNDDVIQYVNPALCNSLGYSAEELLGRRAAEFMVSSEDRTLVKSKVPLRQQNIRDEYEIRVCKKSGEIIWMSVSGSPVVDTRGVVVGSLGVLSDITQRKEAEAALRESEERYALAAHGANDGLWDWDLRTDRIYYSSRWKSMLGCSEDEIGQSQDDWFRRVHPDDLQQMKAHLNAHLEGLTPHFENEHRMLHKDGMYRWMLSRALAVRDASSKAYRLAGSQTDITERKEAVEQLLHDAFHDRLTGLSNRALFLDRLAGAMLRGKRREKYFFAVLCLDLDRFKILNDSLGHAIGDQLLIALSRRLETCLRPGDTVARLSGDEFAVLLDDIADINDATMIAERIQNELQLPFNLRGHEVFTSASIGIALSTTTYERPDDLLRDADTAVYRAKARGKARYEIFDKTMHTRALDQLRLETDLRRAIERKEFILHYQPIVSLRTGSITGFEALLRWQQPLRGLIFPGELIPTAEETGLIIPIGQWVLQEACNQLKKWQTDFPREHPITMSVNLSGKQFSQSDLVKQIDNILKETGLDPQCLKLEITESVVMENAEFAIPMLVQLKNLNVRIEIDDFGTGYSSLSYLHRFPIDTLKIDQSFVSRITPQGENLEIIKTIITLGRNLNMQVIAEGVEKEIQLQHLRNLGCDYAQGYLFARPVDAASAHRLLTQQS